MTNFVYRGIPIYNTVNLEYHCEECNTLHAIGKCKIIEVEYKVMPEIKQIKFNEPQ